MKYYAYAQWAFLKKIKNEVLFDKKNKEGIPYN